MDPKTVSQLQSIENRHYQLAFILVENDQESDLVCHELQKELNVGLISVSLWLSKMLAIVPPDRYPMETQSQLRELINNSREKFIILRDVEFLFEPSLHLDVIGVLKLRSRAHNLIVLWPGSFDGAELRYAEPDHPEYQVGDVTDIPIFVRKDNRRLSLIGG